MSTNTVYPLKQILEVKQRRVEEAEKVVKEKQTALQKEQDKLKEIEAARDKVKEHQKDKLRQLRQMLDEGSTSPKILQTKEYLKTVDEKLKLEEKKVNDQKLQVSTAEKNLEAAQATLKIKRQEVDKLVNHKKDWEKEMRKKMAIIEGREQDELGSTIHQARNRR